MITGQKNSRGLIRVLLTAALMMLLVGCGGGGGAEVNNDDVTYTPEFRPLGVIAGENAEFSPGAVVTLTGRLTGTVTDQTVLWTQVSGTPVTPADWTNPKLTFTAPPVESIETLIFRITAIDGAGNVIQNADGSPMADEVEISVFDPSVVVFYEVEDETVATVNSVEIVSSGSPSFILGAKGGKHTADVVPGASIDFDLTVSADKAGFYTLYVTNAIPSSYGNKQGVVTVNGVPNNVQFIAAGTWQSTRVGVIQLNEGANNINVGGGWSYYRIDNISMIPSAPPAGPSPVEATLVNANASPSAKAVMEFLAVNYGQKTLSGQTEYPSRDDDDSFGLVEFDKVVAATGDDAPAIIAFDLMDFSSSRVANGADPEGLSEDMIAAHDDTNAIMSALWHWNAPSGLRNSEEFPWYGGFYTTHSTFNLAAALADPEGADYDLLIEDIDTIAAELKKFADADIPILWRPLHEAQGAWFWWGASGPDALKSLWVLMYERMTNVHNLNNLIWVFTYAGDLDASWYPGDAYVDIVGYDGYDSNNAENPFSSQYSTLKNRHNGEKLIALTETGTIPNVETMHDNNAWWSFFITWNSGGEYGPDFAAEGTINTHYAYDGVINLVDLPSGPRYGVGTFEDFEIPVSDWAAQLSWNPASGAHVSNLWSSSGAHALSFAQNLSALPSIPSNVVLQAYPKLDVTDVTSISLDVAAVGTGPNTTAVLFVKHGDAWDEVKTTPVAVGDGITLTLDVSGYDLLQGFGVVFENFDSTSTNAQFYVDNMRTNSSVLYDFEPSIGNWGAQIDWSPVSGATLTTDWASSGSRSLALYKDLVAHGSTSNIVLQTYPQGGINVTGKNEITLTVKATGAGSGVNAQIFYKYGAGEEVWGTAVTVPEEGVELSIDVSAVDTLSGLAVRFQNVTASDDAKFYVDNVQVDGVTLYDFEGTGNWEFQVKWTPVVPTGLQLSSEWVKDGSFSLSRTAQLVSGDTDIILQIYPPDNIMLGDVTHLKVTAHAIDAGPGTQVMLFRKDKNGNWAESTSAALLSDGTDLLVDVSGLRELDGFGVRFMGPSNFTTESKYFIDQIEFLKQVD